jgi:predicted esterase
MILRRFAAVGFCLLSVHCGTEGAASSGAKVGSGGAGGSSGDVASGGADAAAPGAGVAIDGVACGGVLDDKLLTPYATITDRMVFIDYPCNLPKGSPVTFVLNLHGTQDGDGKKYIRFYNKLGPNAQQFSFVVATPLAITTQWGNGDNGQDAPHLKDVVNWVYEKFADYDIKQMWVSGHSWGAAYALSFVCLPDYADKIRGLLFMSGGSSLPACADKLSIIATVGETDIVPGQPDQSGIASMHGCDAQSARTLGMDNITEWASCSPGWVHRNYLMLGKGHGFVPQDWPDMAMTDEIAQSVHDTQPK